jgi:hypothetical protein
MARPFKSNSGRPAFGVFSEPLESGDYTLNKKARTTYCVTNNCPPRVRVGSQSNLLLFRRSSNLSMYPCKNSINKANLYINLITELDLKGVPVIADFSGNVAPTTITTTAIPYLDYNIDPCGNLFGNTICGINNFTHYLKYDTPYNYISYVDENYGGPDAINAFDIPAFTNWHCPVTNDWYKVAPSGYILSSFSETGLTTPNSVMSIAFLYDSLQNFRNWRGIFRFTESDSDFGPVSRIPMFFTNPNNNNVVPAYATNSNANTFITSPVLKLNNPYLITMVFNGPTFTFYINKTFIFSQTYGSITGRTANTRLLIGDNHNPSDGNILIKDFTLYDGALSQTDVNNIYDNLTNMPPA